MVARTAPEHPHVGRFPADVPFRVGISACLLGEHVRYDGGHKRDRFLADALGRYVEWVPVCPEVELGLGIPREPIRLESIRGSIRLVALRSRRDLTDEMLALARARAAALAPLDVAGFVLKKDSPSCGVTGVRVHGGAGRPARRGTGLFARVLMERLPLLPVEDGERLHDARLRDNFIERLSAYRRWQRFLSHRPTRSRLIRFHAAHKLLLRAHSPTAYASLRRLIGTAKNRFVQATLEHYGSRFMAALRTPTTPGRHADVLQHMVGYLSGRLERTAREALLESIAAHRRGRVPLTVPLTLVRQHVRRLHVAYLEGQVYLEPHPQELMPQRHS
jgi:uncharacterized protein YbbK (DUF523 family)/uncharacterized protein YbgA (DUF1722 family)